MNDQKGNVLLIPIVVILSLIILGTVGYLYYQNFISVKTQPVTKQPSSAIKREEVSSKSMFQSSQYDIAFEYPSTWTVSEKVYNSGTTNWYVSRVNVSNGEGKVVASFSTGGQVGGACSPDAPLIPTTTIIKDPLGINGIGNINFGYTIIESSKTNYGVAFGLLKDGVDIGSSSVQCPTLSINYRYYTSSNNKALGGITFGKWYAESQVSGDPNTYLFFSSYADAQAYSQSNEFKQIELMIKSLRIGK